jgi:hypothetical protein
MMTDAQIHSMPEAARLAWLDSLQGDEKEIVHCPDGRKYILVMISVIKRFLAEESTTPFYRLKFLEFLDKFSDAWLTPAAVGMIEPMCDDGYEIVKEARQLGSKQFDTYAKHEVFSAFAALNPSLIKAIRFCSNKNGADW